MQIVSPTLVPSPPPKVTLSVLPVTSCHLTPSLLVMSVMTSFSLSLSLPSPPLHPHQPFVTIVGVIVVSTSLYCLLIVCFSLLLRPWDLLPTLVRLVLVVLLSLALLSFNCCSLDGDSCEGDCSGLDADTWPLLNYTLQPKGYHCICLQEPRTVQRSFRVPGRKCYSSGCRCCAACEKNYGVEIWLCDSELIPYISPITGEQKYDLFDFEQVVVVHEDPRILFCDSLCSWRTYCQHSCVRPASSHESYGTRAVIPFEAPFSLL